MIKFNLKRSLILSTMLITPITLTGCALNFAPPAYVQDVSIQGILDGAKDLFSDLSNYIDNSDITGAFDITEPVHRIEEQTGLEFVAATLVRVVDGDTIVVSINGEQKKVRLIGIDTPESVASQEYLDKTGKENSSEGALASAYTKHLLENVKTVYLQKDVSDTGELPTTKVVGFC